MSRRTPEHEAHMASALRVRPHTAAELEQITGLHWRSVSRWITSMRAVGAVHVARWTEDSRGRGTVAVYTWGPGADAPRRKPLTAAERMAGTRARRARERKEK